MQTLTRPHKTAKPKKPSGDIAASYNAAKDFHGQRYTGMKVGRSHKWYYDQGEWKEKKITPDEWDFTYEVKKRRAGKDPPDSGGAGGTARQSHIIPPPKGGQPQT